MGEQYFIRAIIWKGFKDWDEHAEFTNAKLLFRDELGAVSK
jgi:hypothetical protein